MRRGPMSGPPRHAAATGWFDRAGLIAVLSVAVLSHGAVPGIESVSPLALRPGASVEVTFSGSGLAEATHLRANFEAQWESLGEGRFRITPPADCPVGVVAVRLHGSNGVSPLRLLLVDDLPTLTESKTNRVRESAQVVPFGSAIDGRTEELSYDWFRVRANKGQRIALEVVANRIGSRLDSVLRVFNAAGRQLAHNDDAPGLRGDSYLAFTAPAAGDYFIELRDVAYAGSSETFYRLRVGDFPLATAAFPPAVMPGTPTAVSLVGPTGEVGQVQARATNTSVLFLSARGRSGSAFARVLVSEHVEVMEREPNDERAQANRVAWTNSLNGRFDKPNDRDCYAFTARKGEAVEFRAATRSLGAPCDVMLEIQSGGGEMLARSNPTAADEGIVFHRFASNGTYRLVVEETAGAFGANCLYRVTGRRAAGFALSLDTDRFNVAPGTQFDLKVAIARGDYKGAVSLELEGIESLHWTNAVIAEGKSNVTMKVTAPGTLTPGPPRAFSVFGTAARDGSPVRERASTAPALRRQFPQMLYVPPEWDGEATLGIVVP